MYEHSRLGYNWLLVVTLFGDIALARSGSLTASVSTVADRCFDVSKFWLNCIG